MKTIAHQKISAVAAYKHYSRHMDAIETMRERAEIQHSPREYHEPSTMYKVFLLFGCVSVFSHCIYFFLHYELALVSFAIGVILLSIGLYGFFPVSFRTLSKLIKGKHFSLTSDKWASRA